MVHDHSDSKRGNPLPPLQFLISSKGYFICTSLCYTSCGALAGPRNSSVGPSLGIDPTTHCSMSGCSTAKGTKERNVSFNGTLNTFYLGLYGIRHMLKDHSDSERGNPLPPQRLFFLISSNGSFTCIIPQTGQHIPQPYLHQLWSTGWNEK